MKIYWKQMTFALIISAIISILSYYRYVDDVEQATLITVLLIAFFVYTLILYVLVGALTIRIQGKKGFWNYALKFFYWRAIIRFLIGGIGGFVILSYILYEYMNNFYPPHFSILFGPIIAFVIVSPILLFFYRIHQKKKALRKEIEEHFGKRIS